MSDDEPRRPPSDALRRLLEGLGEALSREKEEIEHRHAMDAASQAALDMASAKDGIIIPIGVDHSAVDPAYRQLLAGLLLEQSKASLFWGRLGRDHPYRALFSALGEAWGHAAAAGAINLVQHAIVDHGADPEDLHVGPAEFNAAWVAIAVTAVLGAIRFGQENPEAFKGTEGLRPGEIDEAISSLIDWAATEAANAAQEEPDENDTTESKES